MFLFYLVNKLIAGLFKLLVLLLFSFVLFHPLYNFQFLLLLKLFFSFFSKLCQFVNALDNVSVNLSKISQYVLLPLDPLFV